MIAEEYQHAHEERTQIKIYRNNENVTTVAKELISFRNFKYLLHHCIRGTGRREALLPYRNATNIFLKISKKNFHTSKY
jgi:hypothetical protein